MEALNRARQSSSWQRCGGRTWRWFLESLVEGAGFTYLQAVGHRFDPHVPVAGMGAAVVIPIVGEGLDAQGQRRATPA